MAAEALALDSLHRWRDSLDLPQLPDVDRRFTDVLLDRCWRCHRPAERIGEWLWCSTCSCRCRVKYDPSRHQDEVGRFVIEAHF